MKPRTGLALLVVGLIVLVAGWYFGPAQLPGAAQSIYAGKPMFPGLAERLQTATEVQILQRGKTTTIEKHGSVWGLADRGGYPVAAEKLRTMLTALTELRLVEPRTSNPSEFARLGLVNPQEKDATSKLVRVLDASGKPIAELIVGHQRVLTEGNVPDEVFVRRPGETQTWLAQGSLNVDVDPTLWLSRNIVNIDHSQLAHLTVKRNGTTLAFDAKDGKLVLIEPKDHPALDQYKLDDLARGLELLTCDDVETGPAPSSGEIGQSVFTTTDGMTVTVQLYHDAKNLMARFVVAGQGKATLEASKLNARVSGWTYKIGSWKEASLVPSLADLQSAPTAKTAPTAGATQ
jgi:hypothetical protein